MTACGGSTASLPGGVASAIPEKSDAGDRVQLNWAVWDLDEQSYWQNLADTYMKENPHTVINLIDFGSSDYSTVLATQLAGGADLDVLTIKDIPSYADMVNLGYLEPMNDILERDVLDFEGSIEQISDENGIFYAVPFSKAFWVLFYNKDLFDAAGVDYPTNDMTFAEYDALARQLTSGTGDEKVYGAHYHIWRSCVGLFGVLDGKHTIIDGNYDFLKEPYEMVLEQQKDGICMDYSYLKASNLHYSAVFKNQQAATMNMGIWFLSPLMKDKMVNFRWGIVKYPHPEGVEAGTTIGTICSLAINSNSKKKNNAADFINWCASEEGAKAIATVGALPACSSDETNAIIRNIEGFPDDENSLEALNTVAIYQEMPYTQYAADIEAILNTEHDAIMTESETLDDGINHMNEQVKKLISR
ncbi:MAG: extracellular solute-binding protein [Subdoligranulum variabile]|nr:extracellular solute-binding protein [Subdoligranulum variabile]